jgi:hypothetical protein
MELLLMFLVGKKQMVIFAIYKDMKKIKSLLL